MKIHWLLEPEEKHKEYLIKTLDSQISISFGDSVEYDYEVLIAGRPNEKDINKKSLKNLIIPFVGIPQKTKSLMSQYPHISVHNIHFNDIVTAEMAMALLLTVAKLIVPIDRSFRKNDWRERMTNSLYLANKNILILGYGAIGKKIAKMCVAFNLNVFAVRRTCQQQYLDKNVTVIPLSKLDDILPQIHILMLALPETLETTNLIDAQKLSLLQDKSIIINVGRAAVVNEEALFNALSKRDLFAGFDVWYNYPQDDNMHCCPPANFPFNELSNMIMSPHRASRSDELEYLRIDHIIKLIHQKLYENTMSNKIDLIQGY